MARTSVNISGTARGAAPVPDAALPVSSPQPDRCDVLVLNAGSRHTLATVRSLGRRGLRLAALEVPDSLSTPTFASRWCHQKVVSPAYQETQEHLLFLDQLLAANGARVVIPTSDEDVALLRQYRARMAPSIRLAIAKETALAAALSKEQTLRIASELGLRVPRGLVLDAASDVGAALNEIGLPAVIKPEASWLEEGEQGVRVSCQLVTTPDEARRAVEKLTVMGGKVLFQQFLSGKREAVSFLYAHGTMHARFAQWAKRTNPPLGGISVLRQSIALPADIGEQAERLVREIELEGYSEVEFRRDSNGLPYLMEINPRLSASVGIAIRAGIDFPTLVYQWASGERIDTVEGYRTGLWMRHLGGDIATTIASWRQRGRPGVSSPARALFGFCAAFFVPMSYDYLDWHDLWPAWAAIAGFPRSLLQQARESEQNAK